MTVRINATIDGSCDKCGSKVEDGDGVYCQGCYSEIEAEVTQLRKQIDDLDGELADAKSEVEGLKRDLADAQK